MKKDAKTFKEVAERCTKFCPCDRCGCSNETDYSAQSKTSGSASDCGSNKTGTNSTNDTNKATNSSAENVSCKNCSHYDPNKVCSLDLYTEIVENHHL